MLDASLRRTGRRSQQHSSSYCKLKREQLENNSPASFLALAPPLAPSFLSRPKSSPRTKTLRESSPATGPPFFRRRMFTSPHPPSWCSSLPPLPSTCGWRLFRTHVEDAIRFSSESSLGPDGIPDVAYNTYVQSVDFFSVLPRTCFFSACGSHNQL